MAAKLPVMMQKYEMCAITFGDFDLKFLRGE